MNHIIKTLFTVSLLLLLTACSRFGENNLPAPRALTAFTPTATTTKLWSHSAGSGDAQQDLRFSMSLDNQKIFTLDAKGHVQARDAVSGDTFWKQNLGTPLVAGLSASDSVVAVVTEEGSLIVLDQKTGDTLWSKTLANQALAAPTIANHKVFVKTIDEQVFAFDAQTGNPLWSFASSSTQMMLRFGSSPKVIDNKVIVGTVSGKVFALNADDGAIIWEQAIAEPKGITEVQQMVDIDMDPLIERGVIYLASYQGNLVALQLNSGAVLWHTEFSSFTGMTLKGDDLYVTDADSYLWRLDKSTGFAQWKQDKLAYRGITAPAVLDKFIVLADKEGYLHVVSSENGDLAARINTGNAILSAPLTFNRTVYVLSQNGELSAYEI